MVGIGEEQAEWDKDNLMLIFWENSKAAAEHHPENRRSPEESTEYMKQWRQGVL
jgi:hypothetical protein